MHPPLSDFPATPGTYALVLVCHSRATITVGRLGVQQLEPGYYLYVGSACGPGGLAARLRHHVGIAQRPHWHIDSLRARCQLVAVWFTTDPHRREHAWARTIRRLSGAQAPFPGFGSSDCDCATHLFWFRTRPLCPFRGARSANAGEAEGGNERVSHRSGEGAKQPRPTSPLCADPRNVDRGINRQATEQLRPHRG